MAEKKQEATNEDPTIKGALGRLGMQRTTPATLVIVATAETSLSPETVWAAWSKIEDWPRWSKPMLQSARWLEGRTWVVGSKFEQVRSLGAPIGRQVTVETVREVNPGQSVAWWEGTGPFKTCHLWFFEPLSSGGTRIHKTEVFIGMLFLMFKPLLRRGLTQQFTEAVQGLVKFAERSQHM